MTASSHSDAAQSGEAQHTASSFISVAPYYDELMASVPYRFWVEYLLELFRVHDVSPVTVMDLACGTGSVSLILAGRGFQVTGVDLSPEMLEVAKAKASAAGCAIEFVAQDAVELQTAKRYDVVLSLYDSLNNITEPSRLAQAFQRVFAHLNDYGLFIFDLNTEVAFSTGMFNQQSHPIDGPLQYVWRAAYDPDSRICTVRMDFSYHQRGRGGQTLQFQEVHRQRAYGKDEVAAMLLDAGFSRVAIYDAYSQKPPKKRSDRLFFVARKDA